MPSRSKYGEMYALTPPDLSDAAQIISLDGTPTIELWNLLFAPESGFDHQQVIDREDFPTYLRSSMNMSLIQIGDGWHPYAAGNISNSTQTGLLLFKRMKKTLRTNFDKASAREISELGLLDTFVKRTNSEQRD